MNKTFESQHPSYGMLCFSRVHGSSGRLFGSSIVNHQTFIRLTLCPGALEHNLHHDRYYAPSHRSMVEIDMSANQFAELITAMNIGSGVPVTIRSFDGERVEDPPDIETETERIRSSFQADLADMSKKMQEYRQRIEKLTDKLPAKTKQEVKIALDVITQQLNSNIPFIAKQFDEATERMVTTAKVEIEAYLTHAVTSAGLEALGADIPKASLPAPKESE